MALSYSLQATIPYDMADLNSLVRLPQLMALVMQVSGLHSVEIDMADDKILKEFGLVWIISDHTIKIKRLPHFLETVTIKTQPLFHNRYFCYREYQVFDQEGQEIVNMVTNFMLMDFESRKVQSVVPEIVEAFQSEFQKTIRRGPKFKNLEEAKGREFSVRYYDLDMNGHVNNGKYLEWIYESLGSDFLSSHTPTSLYIKYNREVMADSVVDSQVELVDLVSHHEIHSDGVVNAQAQIEWQPLEK